MPALSDRTPRVFTAAVGLLLIAGYACVPGAEEGGPGRSASGGRGGASSEGRGGSGSGGARATGTGGSSGNATGGSGASATGGSAGGGTPADAAGSASGGTSGGAGGASGDTGGSMPTPTGPFPPGPHKVVLLVGDPNTGDPSRSQMIEILTAMKDTHGIVLEVMNSQMARANMMMDKALIIAGPNNNYCIDTPDAGFRTLPVPIIVSRDCKTTAFGLGTTMNTQNYLTTPVNIVLENTDHPLAAGLGKGTIPVLSTKCRLVRAVDLGPDAIKIARPPADATPVAADSWTIFAYEKGGKMAGGLVAPAKRMGFFWHRPSAVTAEGKKLFIAAIEWSLRP